MKKLISICCILLLFSLCLLSCDTINGSEIYDPDGTYSTDRTTSKNSETTNHREYDTVGGYSEDINDKNYVKNGDMVVSIILAHTAADIKSCCDRKKIEEFVEYFNDISKEKIGIEEDPGQADGEIASIVYFLYLDGTTKMIYVLPSAGYVRDSLDENWYSISTKASEKFKTLANNLKAE